MTITTAQIRGARGILNWSQNDLAERTGISATSIGAIENGSTTPRANTIMTIQKAFEDGGIEFIGTTGLRLRTGDVRVLSGKQGFFEFYDDIYETLRKHPGNVFVSNVDENEFLKWGSDILEPHTERMKELNDIHYKILIKEGDHNYVASSYAEYRWLPKEQFSSVPFYVYGDKLAILLFSDTPTVIVLAYAAVAEAYRVQFETIWKTAITPSEE
ncbi:MAG: helix-turn-helix transcriptional regulator [Rhodospirillales bacterium]|nr:helix-turn-helix transcriptional regulator [Rhodospirillales bacterium]